MSLSETQNPFFRALWLCLAGALVFLAFSAGLLSSKNRIASADPHPIGSTQIAQTLLQLDPHMGRSLLRQGIPLLGRDEGENDPNPIWQTNLIDLFLQWTLDIRYPSPQELFQAQIPLMKWRLVYREEKSPQPEVSVASVENQPETEPLQPQVVIPDNSPKVFIYHTHTSECYIPASGVEHRLNQCGDIVTVGRHLADTLERMGIPTVHSEEIHDQYPFRDSYLRSQKTIIKTLTEYPSLRIVLDIHRDGAVVFEHSPEIHGQRVARIVLVVGSDRMGLSHPYWKRNYRFATELADSLNSRYPGLVNRVIVSDARYNQHLHDHAIIVEIGDQNTRLEEADRSADLLAAALRDYLEHYPNSADGRSGDHPGDETPPAVEATTPGNSSVR